MGASRACELAWLVPWQTPDGSLHVGSDGERSLVLHSAEQLVAQLRHICGSVRDWCGYWVAVSLEGLSEPADSTSPRRAISGTSGISPTAARFLSGASGRERNRYVPGDLQRV